MMNQDDIGVSVGLVDDDDLFVWSVIFEGPEDTLYEVGWHFPSFPKAFV